MMKFVAKNSCFTADKSEGEKYKNVFQTLLSRCSNSYFMCHLFRFDRNRNRNHLKLPCYQFLSLLKCVVVAAFFVSRVTFCLWIYTFKCSLFDVSMTLEDFMYIPNGRYYVSFFRRTGFVRMYWSLFRCLPFCMLRSTCSNFYSF